MISHFTITPRRVLPDCIAHVAITRIDKSVYGTKWAGYYADIIHKDILQPSIPVGPYPDTNAVWDAVFREVRLRGYA